MCCRLEQGQQEQAPVTQFSDITVTSNLTDWSQYATEVTSKLQNEHRMGGEFDCIVHTAGGFVGGGIDAGVDVMELNWKMNVRSAYLTAHLAHLLLKPMRDDSLLVLSGAKGAMESGPSFALSYGMCKAATHHLATSVKDDMNTVCILPTVLDTPANRAAMPDADHSQWTALSTLAQKITQWGERPEEVKQELFIDV